MVLELDIEHNIPYPKDSEEKQSMLERARAVAAAADLLEKHGVHSEIDPEGLAQAREILETYAENPEDTGAVLSPAKISRTPPAVAQLTRQIVEDFGARTVSTAVEIRNIVVNKLIIESENPDPKIRMRAIELLGKMTDVGVFTEKSEVTVTHRSSAELRDALKAKLRKLKDVSPVTDAEVIDHD